MKNKHIYTLLVSAVALVLVGCRNNAPEKIAKLDGFVEQDFGSNSDLVAESSEIPSVYVDIEYAQKQIGEFSRELVDFRLPVSYFVRLGDDVYYVFAHDIWTNMSKRYDFYCRNNSTGAFSCIASVFDDNAKAMLSFTASEDSLYWSTISDNNEWEICEYSIKNATVAVLCGGVLSEYERAPIVTFANGALHWYSEDDENTVNLLSMSPNDKKIVISEKNVISKNPYERTTGKAFIKSENGAVHIVCGNDNLKIDASPEIISLVAANDNYLIWLEQENSNSSKVCVYDRNSKSQYFEHISGYMGAGVIGNCFYINRNVIDSDSAEARFTVYDTQKKVAYTRILSDKMYGWAYPINETELALTEDSKVLTFISIECG